MAKLLDEVPVFMITFFSQQMNIVRDTQGSIVEGDEVYFIGQYYYMIDYIVQANINNVQYVWALSRDQSIYNPKAAWRLSEFAIHSENQLLI